MEQYFSVAAEIEDAIDINLKRDEHLRQAILKKAFSGRRVPADKIKMDTFKHLDKVCSPDERQRVFVIFDDRSGQFRERTINDHYSTIQEIKLTDTVPEKIRIHFETAKNILLYSWYVYRFVQVAELHAYSSVEFALKEKAGSKNMGLKRLIKLAIKKGWVSDGGFRLYNQRVRKQLNNYKIMVENKKNPEAQSDMDDNQKYCRILADALPSLRNDLAHGSSILSPGGYAQLAICADLINQLFS